jgi:hypothetical protein
MAATITLTNGEHSTRSRRQSVAETGSLGDPYVDGPETVESFRSSIQAFVRLAESNVPADYLVSQVLNDFHFQRRRMYDVVSVFCAIGCCQKVSVDLIRWIGMLKVPLALMKLQRDAGADSPDSTLDAIIGSHTTVSISRLTGTFLLCFLALRMRRLDIKQISRYLSRKAGRYKSILCKLYQIAHILEAARVITRSEIPGQLTIDDKYFAPVDINVVDKFHEGKNPYGIDSILNHIGPAEKQILLKRRTDFCTEFEKSEAEQSAKKSDLHE